MADVRTIQRAWKKLRDEGIDGVLVGTAALQLHGYEVDAPDIDFLVERKPREVEEYEGDDYTGEGYRIDRVKVDYVVDGIHAAVPGPSNRGQFFHPERAVRIAGVPVAALDDVVGLKHWRGRPKDHATLFDLGLHPDQHK